jgi:hypothetical protein
MIDSRSYKNSCHFFILAVCSGVTVLHATKFDAAVTNESGDTAPWGHSSPLVTFHPWKMRTPELTPYFMEDLYSSLQRSDLSFLPISIVAVKMKSEAHS